MEKKFNYFSRCPIYVSKEHEEHVMLRQESVVRRNLASISFYERFQFLNSACRIVF